MTCWCGQPSVRRLINTRPCSEHAPPVVTPDPAATLAAHRTRTTFKDTAVPYGHATTDPRPGKENP